MEKNARRVVEPWIPDAPPLEEDGVWNISRPVRWHNHLWEERTRGTAAAFSQAMIWPAGNNKPKSPAGLCSLSSPCIRFVRSTLMLKAKDARHVFDPWIWDAPTPDGNVWVWQRQQAQKGLLQSLILWGGGHRHMGDKPKE